MCARESGVSPGHSGTGFAPLDGAMCARLARGLLLLVTIAVAAGAEPMHRSTLAARALAACAAADQETGATREALLRVGLRLAEEAVDLDGGDADAHFAVFCNLGKQVDDRGLGFRTLLAVRRLRRTIDRALAIRPDHTEALVAKAAMLLRLPRALGGDPLEAEACLARALELRPDHPVALSIVAERRRAAATVATVTR